MNMYGRFSLLLIIMLVLPACDWTAKEPSIRILDVNAEKIFMDAHLPGAIHLTYAAVDSASKGWNKSTPIVVYCSDYACSESHRVAKKLRGLGFTDVAVYSGGIQEWYQLSQGDKAAYPFEGEAQQPFLRMEIEEPVIEEPVKEEDEVISAAALSQRLAETK